MYFVAGEASADNHGAALMRALRKADVDLRFVGRGGPQMKAVAGDNFQNWIDKSGVLGLWEVIKHYGYFRKQFHQTLDEIGASKPNAVVLIDYPGFNLRLARALRKRLQSQKIIYYISPQVWAWNRSRIKKMAHWLDLMLCIFPFEAELYNQSGLRTIFVGHPMIERLRDRQPSVAAATYGSAGKIDIQRDSNLVGLFPGSRGREVRKIFPILVQTARELRRSKPDLHFEVAAASDELAQEMEKMLGSQDRHLFGIKIGQTAEIMQRAVAGIVASGSATLEAAYFRMPFALIYKVAWPTYFAGRLLVKVKYLGMPNVLADKQVVPEFIQHRAKSPDLAKTILRLLDDPMKREQMISEFDKIAAQLGESGASERAATAILSEISS
ncbi:MAG: lipid-A-disaccharide synthase [Verrucomicrobia bacterium]|nr:MAG: lipid-A-disaccharide synthase [Verrucomicrobiota bacterium]PYL96216.1 MAG: lipid-A-disaccharide synthase [Verrucomicrobiota bacterium]